MQFRSLTAAAAAALLTVASSGAAVSAEPVDTDAGTGSLSLEALDLAGAAADLAVAAKALNGPVTVVPGDEGGATITYTNDGAVSEQCVGFAAPYSTITELDLDVGYDTADMAAGLALLQAIESRPGVSLLLGDENGAPIVEADDPAVPDSIAGEVVGMLFQWIPENPPPREVVVKPGETVAWTTTVPDSPVASGVICIAGPVDENSQLVTNFGIDKQVVADQVNAKIPGGSLDVVSAGSISGGSVTAGASALGSLAADDAPEDVVE